MPKASKRNGSAAPADGSWGTVGGGRRAANAQQDVGNRGGNGGGGSTSGPIPAMRGSGAAGHWLCHGVAGKCCGYLVPRGKEWCDACGNHPPAHVTGVRSAPAAGKSNGKGEGSGASGSAAISPGSPPPDLRYNWTCSNCSDGAAVTCTGKQPCRLCGQRAPEWVHKGLTQNEELLRKAKAFGNRTDGIELSIKRERRAAKRREAAAAGNSCSGKGAGDVRASPAYRALQAKLDQRDAEFAKLKKEAAGGSAAAGVAPEVDAPGADPAGAGEADMEVDTHKTHQAAAREAEESVQEWQAMLDPLVKKTFPDGTADEQALQQSDATGGVYRKLLEARAARDAARERVRDSRPLAGQIALKRKGLSKLEGQIAANQQKGIDLGKAAEEMQKRMEEFLQQQSAVVETTRGQQARFKLQS